MDPDIVIAGVACRYPGLENVEQFAEFVQTEDARVSSPRTITKDKLDTSQFCVHAHQAENCDPQIRILLHCAREALCDAALHCTTQTSSYSAKDPARALTIGCIVSCEVSDYGESVGYDIPALSGYGVLGGCRAMIANRISFECNLTGPSYTLASGNSLIALHNAVSLIRNGRCDVMVVGAIELNLKVSYTRVVKLLDPDINRSEGGGIVVLARRDIAVKDYGTLGNTWTRFVGSAEGEEVRERIGGFLRTALESSGEGAGGESDESVQVIGDNSWNRNIGHMEKEVLGEMSKTTHIRYQLHGTISMFGDLGSASGFTSLLLAVFQNKKPLPVTYITSCGLTGTYCLVKYRRKISKQKPATATRFLSIAGQNISTVEHVLQSYRNSSQRSTLYSKLQDRFSQSGLARGVYDAMLDTTETETAQNRPLWLVVGGVGANWDGMGQNLAKLSSYSASVSSSEEMFEKFRDLDIDGSGVFEMLSSLLKFQIAHIDILKELGVEFDGVIGHSFGEIAALYATETITRNQAVQCAAYRAISVEKSAEGAMLAVSLTDKVQNIRSWAAEILDTLPIDLACVNSSTSFVLAGTEVAVYQARSLLEQQGARCTLLKTHHKAFHSRHMLKVSQEYRNNLQPHFPKPLPPPSNFHSTSNQGTYKIDADYFVTNMTRQVKFYDTYTDRVPDNSVILELSPHPMFCKSLERDLVGVRCIPLSLRNSKTTEQLAQALKQVHLTCRIVDLSFLGGVDEGEVQEGSLLKWDLSQTWYVPKQEHFPVLGAQKLQLSSSTFTHFSLDVSKYDLNEDINSSIVMVDVIQHLAQHSDEEAFILSGKEMKSTHKRSSNNYVDVHIQQNQVEIIYNGFLLVSGNLNKLPAAKTRNCSFSQDDYNNYLDEITKIEQKNEVSELALYFNIMPAADTQSEANIILNTGREIGIIWKGTPKQEQEQTLKQGSEDESGLVKKTKKLLGVNIVSDPRRKLIEYGLDSLMSVELIEMLKDVTGIELDNSDIMNLSFKDLAEIAP
ncbi:hypothetical protein ACHWQZ_G002860 [Mnemiopsis leidyi]